MKKTTALALALVVMALMAGIAFAAHHAVKVAEKEGIGRYLTDTEGMTLYWFKKDSAGKSACAGPCLDKWPIYYREQVAATGGLKAEDFGTITREDGKMQTTFRGLPLYYWAGDRKAGDAGGQGIGNVWYIVNPDTFPPK